MCPTGLRSESLLLQNQPIVHRTPAPWQAPFFPAQPALLGEGGAKPAGLLQEFPQVFRAHRPPLAVDPQPLPPALHTPALLLLEETQQARVKQVADSRFILAP